MTRVVVYRVEAQAELCGTTRRSGRFVQRSRLGQARWAPIHTGSAFQSLGHSLIGQKSGAGCWNAIPTRLRPPERESK